MTTSELIAHLKHRMSSIIMKMRDTDNQNIGVYFQYNSIFERDGNIIFSKETSADEIILRISEITQVSQKESDPDVIYIDLSDGDRWLIHLCGYGTFKETSDLTQLDFRIKPS